jgi:hypothetical protein
MMKGYAVLLTIGRRLVYFKRFNHDKVKEAVSHYCLLTEGEIGKEVEVTFTNDLDLPDVLLTQTAELDDNPLVI